MKAATEAVDRALAAVIARRPDLVDGWEATAVAESLGYTSDRVRRELGFEDARAFGEFVYERLAERTPAAAAEALVPLPAPGAAAAARAAALMFVVYGVMWATVVAADRSPITPAAWPPLTLALIAALVATGGFVEGMIRRGARYRAEEQPAFATMMAGLLWRIGAVAALAVAAGGIAVGWVFDLASVPALIIWADLVIVVSAVLLTGGRVAAGGAPWTRSRRADDAAIPPPRLEVVVFRTLPVVMLGSLGLAFAFLAPAVVAIPADAGWRGVEVAVIVWLAAMAVSEYAVLRFSTRLREATPVSFGATAAMGEAGSTAHLHVLALVGGVFVIPAAGLTALDATYFPAVIGYLLLALGVAQARLLLELARPWLAVGWIGAGLGVAVMAMASSLWLGTTGAALPVSLGAAITAAGAFVSVRLSLRRPEYALLRP